MSNHTKNVLEEIVSQKPEVTIVKRKKVKSKVFYKQGAPLLYDFSLSSNLYYKFLPNYLFSK